MANTPNFNLYKPNRDDTTVEVDTSLSTNFDIIDTKLKEQADGLTTHKNDVLAHASDKISHADGSVKTTLENHEERILSNEAAKNDHETRLDSAELTVTDHRTRLTDVELKATDIDTRVTDIEVLGIDKLAPNLEGRITTLESDIEGVMAPATFASLDASAYTFDDLKMGYVDNKLAPVNEKLTEHTTLLAEKVSQAELQAVDTKITNIGSGSPKGTYATLTALQTAFPTGTTGIYLVTADGKWYYWDGATWFAGGTYQATGLADEGTDAGKLMMKDTLLDWEIGNISFSGGTDQVLDGYIRTKGYIYAPKGTVVFNPDTTNYKMSIHSYDLTTKVRSERVWETTANRHIVSTTCYIRLGLRRSANLNPITVDDLNTMKTILKLNKLISKFDVEEIIDKSKDYGKNSLIALSFLSRYSNNTRAESTKNISISGVSQITIVNKSSDFSIGIRQKDANGATIIDNGWTLKEAKNVFSILAGTTSLQLVFGKSDSSVFTLNDIPMNLFAVYFDSNLNDNKINYFNNYVKENIESVVTVVQNPLNTSVKAVNHRGYDTHPENTISAFKKSKEMGYSYVETDVLWTSDNVPVLLHDDSINRTARNTDGTTIVSTVNIADITFATAQTYDFGIYKGAEFAGTKIPSFEEFIVLCKRLNLHPYIELKGGTDAQIIGIVDIVRKKGMLDRVSWLSSVSVCAKLLAQYSKSRIVVVTNSTDLAVVDSIAALKTNDNKVSVDYYIGNITQTMIEYAHSKGIEAEVWTTDTEADIKNLATWGIDGITTNHSNIAQILNY